MPRLPGPVHDLRVRALARARRGSAKALTRASRIPVVRPFAELGMRALFDQAAPHWTAIRSDRAFEDGLARRSLIDAFRVIEDDALVSQYRRKMSSLLF